MGRKLALLLLVTLLGLQFAGAEPKKQPLTDRQIQSGMFRYLQQITGQGVLGLRILYEASGAEKFEEFAFALTVAHILGLDQQLVLRALYEHDLEEILEQMGIPEKDSDGALKLAKKRLKKAEELFESRER